MLRPLTLQLSWLSGLVQLHTDVYLLFMVDLNIYQIKTRTAKQSYIQKGKTI